MHFDLKNLCGQKKKHNTNLIFGQGILKLKHLVLVTWVVNRRSAPRYFLVCGLAQVKCLSQGSPLKHDGRRKTTKRKKRAKGFQGFLYGTSGGRNSKGSSPGPPGRKNKNKNFKKIKTGTYHWEKHIACFMHICNVRSQVFFPGVWVCLRDFILFFIFLAALSANLHCGKTLGLEKSFEHGKVFQEYGWETRTFEEGKKKAPLIQGGGLRQAHTIEKVENPSSRLLNTHISICRNLQLWIMN